MWPITGPLCSPLNVATLNESPFIAFRYLLVPLISLLRMSGWAWFTGLPELRQLRTLDTNNSGNRDTLMVEERGKAGTSVLALLRSPGGWMSYSSWTMPHSLPIYLWSSHWSLTPLTYLQILDLMLSGNRHVCDTTKKGRELSTGKTSNLNLKVEISTPDTRLTRR